MKYLILLVIMLSGCTSPHDNPKVSIGTNVTFAPSSDYAGCTGVALESEIVKYGWKSTEQVRVQLKSCGLEKLKPLMEVTENEVLVLRSREAKTINWVGIKVNVTGGTYKGCTGVTTLSKTTDRSPATEVIMSGSRAEGHRYVKNVQCQDVKMKGIYEIPENYLKVVKE